MSNKKAVQTTQAPAAIGPYSQAISLGNLLFCSGQIPLIPESMQMETGDVKAQTRQVLANLNAVLQAGGSSPAHVLKTTIFLKNMSDFAHVNAEYEAFFKQFDAPAPARSTVEVAALPKGALVEIEAIASR